MDEKWYECTDDETTGSESEKEESENDKGKGKNKSKMETLSDDEGKYSDTYVEKRDKFLSDKFITKLQECIGDKGTMRATKSRAALYAMKHRSLRFTDLTRIRRYKRSSLSLSSYVVRLPLFIS